MPKEERPEVSVKSDRPVHPDDPRRCGFGLESCMNCKHWTGPEMDKLVEQGKDEGIRMIVGTLRRTAKVCNLPGRKDFWATDYFCVCAKFGEKK